MSSTSLETFSHFQGEIQRKQKEIKKKYSLFLAWNITSFHDGLLVDWRYWKKKNYHLSKLKGYFSPQEKETVAGIASLK